MRKVIAMMAFLAVLAVPAVAQAASITVTKHTTNGDRVTGFPFYVTGPKCDGSQDIPGTSQRIDFVLAGGQSKMLKLCDTPPEKGKRFVVTESVPSGWNLDSVVCKSTDTDPKDAFMVEPPSVFVELSPDESKSCVFTNSPQPVPTPPVVVTPPAPAPTVVVAPPAPAPTVVVAPPAAAPPAPVAVPVAAPAPAPRPAARHHRKVCRYGRVVIKDRHHHRATRCKAAPRQVRRSHPKRRPNFTG